MNLPNGSYYIRVRPTGWYLWHQSYVNGKRVQTKVDGKALVTLGFKREWSIDEAKAHCSQLNKERSFIKEKVRLAAKRVTELRSINETLFPQSDVEHFQHLLAEENFGSEAHFSKLISQFNFIQQMVNELRILPQEYKLESKRIYKYFIKRKISINYATRLTSLLNRWGRFKCRASATYYDEVAPPRGNVQSAIADAQQSKQGTNTELGVRTESAPLTPTLLEAAKDRLKLEQYNWLYLSVWLGLRPEEVEALRDPKKFKLEYSLKHKIHYIKIYQSKLKSVAADKRWKTIPLIFPEQSNVPSIIKSGAFVKPLNKIVRKYVGAGITLYGGRKGFVDLMLSLGQRIEDISMWLGHKDISTTWKHYKDKEVINFTPLKRVAK